MEPAHVYRTNVRRRLRDHPRVASGGLQTLLVMGVLIGLLPAAPAFSDPFQAATIFHPDAGTLRKDGRESMLAPLLRAIEDRNQLSESELRIIEGASRRPLNLIQETGAGATLADVWLRLLEVEAAVLRGRYWSNDGNRHHEIGVVLTCSFEACYDPQWMKRRLLALSGAPRKISLDASEDALAVSRLNWKRHQEAAQEHFLVSLMRLGSRADTASKISLPIGVVLEDEPEPTQTGILSLKR